MPNVATAPTATAAQTSAAGSRILGYYLGGGGVKVDCLFDTSNFMTKDASGKYNANGQICGEDGAAGAPAISFQNDPDTGFYRLTTNAIGIATGGALRLQIDSSGNVLPGAAGTQIFGWPSVPWGNSYFAVAPTITSDRNSKTDITAIPEAHLDAWADVEWVRYQLLSDDSEHVGLVAQQVHEAFATHDLDAIALGFVVRFEWDAEPAIEEVRDGEGNLITSGRGAVEAGEVWMLRYAECQAMEAAWQRREIARQAAMIADQGARIAALEAHLAAPEQ